MAEYIVVLRRRRNHLRRNRVFRDRNHPLELYDDAEIVRKFRFDRQSILELTDSVSDRLQYPLQRRGALTPVLQVLLTLRFYATGTFQEVVGELIGVDQSTASRTVHRVTAAFLPQLPHWISLPSRAEAGRMKQKFYAMQQFPNVVGCVDGTHVRIQAPQEVEHEYVNRKNFHSINVQVG